jgi:predicted DNA-binding antitoxin AbrB/MazE fold protein
MCLLYHADSDQVTCYTTENDHEHDDDPIRGVNEKVKQVIVELYNDGVMKPKQIMRALEGRKIKTPTYRQLNSYLVYLRKKKYGSHQISLGELEQWCQDNQSIPSDEDAAFVVSYEIRYDDEDDEDDEDAQDYRGSKFRMFISSLRLLNITSSSSHINADATYKLVWQGFPVLVVGTTHLNKSFHPFGLAICSNEKTKDFEFIFKSLQTGLVNTNKDLFKPTALVSDAADAIMNGFRKVFDNPYEEIMCWAHMKRKVNNRVCHIDDKLIAKEVLEDIEMIQLSNSKVVFQLASSLFLKKWTMNNKQKNQSVLDFLDYFQKEWLESNDGWYEGVQLYVPSTNNALEATNRTIKDDGTFRERHVLSRFLQIASDIVNNWSKERDSSSINAKIFATEPNIPLSLWTSSYQWAKSTKDVIRICNNSSETFYIPARDLKSITQAELTKYKKKKWTTFNMFRKSFDIWCMEMEKNEDWRKAKCNCPMFLKNYICKHIVGMAIRLKLCKPPPAAKTIPIGEKRKRGRPAKAKPALLLQ